MVTLFKENIYREYMKPALRPLAENDYGIPILVAVIGIAYAFLPSLIQSISNRSITGSSIRLEKADSDN